MVLKDQHLASKPELGPHNLPELVRVIKYNKKCQKSMKHDLQVFVINRIHFKA